jgi:hypothetical protein
VPGFRLAPASATSLSDFAARASVLVLKRDAQFAAASTIG